MPRRLLDLHPIGLTFGGVHLSQTWADLYIWEKVLNETDPKIVIELGTYKGGFALWLEAQARVRRFDFHTFDNGQYGVNVEGLHFLTNFHNTDVFSFDGFNLIKALIAKGRTVIFCDNGQKEREAATFGPLLKKEDVLAVHDWGTECNRVPNYLKLYTPEGIDYEALKSMTRFFKR